MQVQLERNRYRPEEYLDLERKAEYKSEYINGFIFAMAGASKEHNQITLNIASEIHHQLKGRPCFVYSNDMRVRIVETGMYAYPDIVATCSSPKFEDSYVDTLLNPMLIIEVLSDSTEAYDRGQKFAHYRRLASLTDYVLVAQDRACVEHYVRRSEQWILTEVSGLEGTIQLGAALLERRKMADDAGMGGRLKEGALSLS